jgi:gamma-glutamylcyclotransferase
MATTTRKMPQFGTSHCELALAASDQCQSRTVVCGRAREENQMQNVIVFAYGSNLSVRQMRSRCPSARVEARAALPNHALAFGGFSRRWGGAVASVVPEPGSLVEGLLYCVGRSDLSELDAYEGHPFAYERISRLVTDERGRRRRAALYWQRAERFEPDLPQPDYFRILWRAYGRLGFDVAPLAIALGLAS